ncbi:cyclin-dependent kinase 5, partial [Ceratobasidium sp. 423]
MQSYFLDKTRPIGQGSFGRVFRGKDRRTNQIVAVKQMRYNRFAEGIPGLGMREISNMRAVEHKRVARLIDAEFAYEGHINIVMEYCDMDLHR